MIVPTVEEFDDICEIHVVVNDDFSIKLHQRQCYEQYVVGGTYVFGCPYRLPNWEHIVVHQFWKKKPNPQASKDNVRVPEANFQNNYLKVCK